MYFVFDLESSCLVKKDFFRALYLGLFAVIKLPIIQKLGKKIPTSCRDESAELLIRINLQTLPSDQINSNLFPYILVIHLVSLWAVLKKSKFKVFIVSVLNAFSILYL